MGRPATPGRAGDPVAEEEGEGLEEELEEQAEKTENRLEALEAAREAGTLGVIEEIRRQPADGWAGERVMHRTGDDWEPAIAADPNAPWVYVLHNRYGGRDACPNDCPDPARSCTSRATAVSTGSPSGTSAPAADGRRSTTR